MVRVGYPSVMTLLPTAARPIPPDVLRARLARAGDEAAARGLDSLLITPSPDFAYLLGYRPPELERLTCLVVAVIALGIVAARLVRHER